MFIRFLQLKYSILQSVKYFVIQALEKVFSSPNFFIFPFDIALQYFISHLRRN
jgi:hypothetical protein